MPHPCTTEEAAVNDATAEVNQKQSELDIAQIVLDTATLDLLICQTT